MANDVKSNPDREAADGPTAARGGNRPVRLDAAKLHRCLADACAAAAVGEASAAHDFAVHFLQSCPRAPRLKQPELVRVALDERHVDAALAAGCEAWKQRRKATRPARDYALRYLPTHLVRADLWKRAEELLCDLKFVEAKVQAGLATELDQDYVSALAAHPDGQQEREKECAMQERARRYGQALVAYARAWSDWRNARELHRQDPTRHPPPPGQQTLPPLPGITCEPLSANEEVEPNRREMVANLKPLERLRAFATFVATEQHNLTQFGVLRPPKPPGKNRDADAAIRHAKEVLYLPGFVLQSALNFAPNGPVRDAAEKLLPQSKHPMLLRQFHPSKTYNPRPACLRTLTGHRGSVRTVAVTADGGRAVSGSDDRTVKVWDLATGKCTYTLEGHASPVWSVAVTPDGGRAVSGSYDGRLGVWDLRTGQWEHTLEGHSAYISSVAVTPDGRRALSGSGDETLKVWDLATGKCVHTLERLYGPIWAVAVTADGRRAVSCSRGRGIMVWDFEAGKEVCTFERYWDSVWAVAVTPNGTRAVSATDTGTLRVWDVATLKWKKVLVGHEFLDGSLAVTPDGGRAMLALGGETLTAWDLVTGNCVRTLKGHTVGVTSVVLTADGRRAVSGSADQTLKVWDVVTGECSDPYEGHGARISSLVVTPDGRRAVSGSYDRTLKVWNIATGKCLYTLKGHDVRKFGTGAYRQIRESLDPLIHSVAMTSDGGRAVSGADDGMLKVWELATGKCLHTMKGHTSVVRSVALTSDAGRAVSGSEDQTLKVWELVTGKCLHTLIGHTSWISSLAVTPNGRWALSGSGDGMLKVWDLTTGRCLHTMRENMREYITWVSSVAVTPDGKRAVSASLGPTFKLWDLAAGKCLRICEGHRSGVSSVMLTADGKRAVSASMDGTLKVWDLATGKCLANFTAEEPINSSAVALGGPWVIAGSAQGEVIRLVLHG